MSQNVGGLADVSLLASLASHAQPPVLDSGGERVQAVDLRLRLQELIPLLTSRLIESALPEITGYMDGNKQDPAAVLDLKMS